MWGDAGRLRSNGHIERSADLLSFIRRPVEADLQDLQKRTIVRQRILEGAVPARSSRAERRTSASKKQRQARTAILGRTLQGDA